MAGLIPFELPQGPNVNLLMQPLQQGLQSYRQGMDKQFEGERALEKERLAQRADARAEEDQSFQREQRLVQRMGAMAQVIADDPNPQTAAANWAKLHQSMPQLAERLKAYGVDPSNYKIGSSFIAAEAGKYKSPIERQTAQAQLQHLQGQNAVNAAQLAQLKMQTPEYRASVAEKYGLQPGTAAHNAFVISGQYTPDTSKFQVIPEGASVMAENPRTGQATMIHQGTPKVDSTAKKAIFEAQDELPQIRSSLELINEAKALLPKIYTGYGSAARSNWNQGSSSLLPNLISDPERAAATQRFNQIMDAESIQNMSQTLKGASTDREMMAFVKIYNDPNVSTDTKMKVLDSILRKTQAHYQNKVDRINELGGRMPGTGVPGSAPAAGGADPLGIR